MLIRVSTDELKKCVERLLRGKQKAYINFHVRVNRLVMQMLGGLIVEASIPVLYVDTVEDFDITVSLDKRISLLNKKESITEIQMFQEMLTIQQQTFMFGVRKEPLLRMDLSKQKGEEETIKMYQLYQIVSASKALDPVAKSLAGVYEPIHIIGSKAYILYSNMLYSNSCNCRDMCISADVARSLFRVIKSDDVSCCVFGENSLLLTSQQDIIAASITYPDYQIARVAQDLYASMKKVSDISIINEKEALAEVCKIYRGSLLDVAFCTDGVRVSFYSGNTQFSVGASGSSQFNIKLSAAQLEAITRVFGSCEKLSVKRGENKICLEQETSQERLIVSGLLF